MPTVVRLCSVILLFFTKFRVRGNIKVRINISNLCFTASFMYSIGNE